VGQFFFDFRDDGTLVSDDVGGELPTREKGREEAIGALALLMKDRRPYGDQRTFAVDMRDDSGRIIFTATLTLTAHWTE